MPQCDIDFDDNGVVTRYKPIDGLEWIPEYDSDGSMIGFKYGDSVQYKMESVTNLKRKLINCKTNAYTLISSDMQGHILNAETSTGYKCRFKYDEEWNLIGYEDDSSFSQKIDIDTDHTAFVFDGPEDFFKEGDDRFLSERYEFDKTFSVIKYINSMGRGGVIKDDENKNKAKKSSAL